LVTVVRLNSVGAVNRGGEPASTAILSAAAERRLVLRVSEGDSCARDALARAHLPLVAAIARALGGRGVAHEDLVQEGFAGLLQAIDRFDHERGTRLASYASWWIRRSMLTAIGAAASIRLPDHARRDLAKVLAAESELAAQGVRSSEEAVVQRTGLASGRVRSVRQLPHVVASLDAPTPADGLPLSAVIGDPVAEGAGAGLGVDGGGGLGAGRVLEAVAALPPRMREVLTMRFGLDTQAERRYQRIGELLGLSAERVRQIEAQGLLRLRDVAAPLAAAG